MNLYPLKRVILSEAKDLLSLAPLECMWAKEKKQILRFAQDDTSALSLPEFRIQ